MTDELLGKWLAVWDPLSLGQFGNSRCQGMGLTCGQFWVRTRGGYNLYRWTGDRYPVGVSGSIVGAAPAWAASITSFPFVGHAAGTCYWYLIRAVGAGGVEEQNESQIARAEFNASGEFVGPRPNAPLSLDARPMAGGQVALYWRYSTAGQEIEPFVFEVFADVGGAMDWQTAIGSVGYRRGQVDYSWTSGAFGHGAQLRFAVRARSAAGVLERNEQLVVVESDASGPPLLPTFVATLGQEQR